MGFRFDAIVVGGGHNGLVAAAYLAQCGQKVLVLEGSDEFGGATKSLRVFPDYDVRVSRYSYLISLLPEQIIRELKIDFKTVPRRIASYTCFDDDAGQPRGLILSNEDPQLSRHSLRALDSRVDSWNEYQQFCAVQGAMARMVWPTLLKPLQSKDTFKSQLDSDLKREAWKSIVEEPLGNFIESTITNDTLRGLLFTDAKIGVFTNPDDGQLLQNRCFLYHAVGQGTGTWTVPLGGMGSLVDALVSRCVQLGVILHAQSPAVRIEAGVQEQTVIIDHDGAEKSYCAKRVFVAAGPRVFQRLLGEVPESKNEDEGSVAKVNMLLRKLPRLRAFRDSKHPEVTSADAFTGSLHVDEGYEAMCASFEQAARGEIPERPPFEVYCHSLTDPSILGEAVATRGWHTLTLFGLDVPYRLFKKDNAQTRAALLGRYLEAFDRICEEPFQDCLAMDSHGQPCIEIKTASDLEQELGLDQGNIFHNAPSWFFAEGNDDEGLWGCETKYPGIFIAGSSAIRGGAVSGIPGRNAVACALGHDFIGPEFTGPQSFG